MKLIRSQSGVGLIEVLVAAVVFAVGIAAVAKLQGTFFKSSSSANARATAMSLAEAKMEDLRAFQQANSADVDIFGFNHISGDGAPGGVAEAGGRCTEQDTTNNICTLSLPATTISIGNTSYTRTWAVTNYYYDTAGLLCTPFPTGTIPNTCVAATGAIPDQKAITVTVSWTDSDGTSQTAAVSGVINNYGEYTSGSLVTNATGGAYPPHRPGGTDNNVNTVEQDIDLDGDTHKETLSPVTTFDNSGGSDYTETVLTSNTYGGGYLIRMEEFKVINCECSLNGTGQGFTPARAVWNPGRSWNKFVDINGNGLADFGVTEDANFNGVLDTGEDTNSNGVLDTNELTLKYGSFIDKAGDYVTKTVGVVADNKQAEGCDICCRDHHDVQTVGDHTYCNPDSTVSECYDPFRAAGSTDDHTSGQHNHYASSASTTPVTSGNYLEACRLKRVDGFWRVYQDWHQVGLLNFPQSVLSDSTQLADYKGYVKDLIDQHLIESKVAGETLTSAPVKPTSISYPSDSPIDLAAVGNTKQLTARGIYLDYMNPELLSAVRCKKDHTISGCTNTSNEDYLVHVPFYEVDLTKLAQWSSADASKVSISTTTTDGNPSLGGLINAVATTTSSVAVTAKAKKSNTGLVNRSPIDIVATLNKDSDFGSDAVYVSVAGGSGDPGNTGNTLPDPILTSPLTATLTKNQIHNIRFTIADAEDTDEMDATYLDNITVEATGTGVSSQGPLTLVTGLYWQYPVTVVNQPNKSINITITVVDNNGASTTTPWTFTTSN